MITLKRQLLSSDNLNFILKCHKCVLPPHEDVIVRYISSGKFVYVRRYLKQLMLINEKFPITMQIFKSISVVRAEQERHLRKHLYMIHPFSTWCYYWNMMQFIVHLICFLVLPFEISAEDNTYSGFLILFDFFFYADVVICFFTGRLNENMHYVTMSQKIIAKRYLSTFFIPDLVGSLGAYTLSQIVMYFFNDRDNFFWISKTVLYLKLIRLRNLCKYLRVLFEYVHGDQQRHTMIKTGVLAIIFFMWYSSIAVLIIVRETPKYVNLQKENLNALIYLTSKTMHLFLLYGYERNHMFWERSNSDLGWTVTSYTLGMVFNVFLVAYIMYAVDKFKSTTYKHLKNVRQLNDFCETKNLSEKLTKRVQEMYEFKYKKGFFRDDYIMTTISQQLKDTIDMQICYDLLGEVKIFSDIPLCILSRLVALMEAVYFLNNDIIVRDGEVGDSMFFISFGSVAVYASNGIEICHLDQGMNFGEIAIALPNQKRVATVVAIECCELYKLTKKSFEHIITPYPEICQRIQKIALTRLEKATKFVKENPVHESDD